MAVALEFIDFVVPIALIRQKYPGGWEQCLKDHERLIGARVWFDDHLLRDGAMNPRDIESLVEEWSDLGFEPTGMIDGQHGPRRWLKTGIRFVKTCVQADSGAGSQLRHGVRENRWTLAASHHRHIGQHLRCRDDLLGLCRRVGDLGQGTARTLHGCIRNGHSRLVWGLNVLHGLAFLKRYVTSPSSDCRIRPKFCS